MGIVKKLLTNWKIWIYIIFFVLMLFAINPHPWNEGATVRTVVLNSSAYNAGMQSANPKTTPITREKIVDINGVPINSAADYNAYLRTLIPNVSLTITTEKFTFLWFTEKKFYSVHTSDPSSMPGDIELGIQDLGISVYDAPKSNIRLGLDLQGGTRVVLQPEKKLETEDMDALIDNLNERLNVYGLSDIVVRSAGDLSGNQFVIVEIAGANKEEVKELLSKQGKFEAKIGNESVFLGGKDIVSVCRTSQCSGLDPQFGCQEGSDGNYCRFFFQITLSQDAADRQAEVTDSLDIVYDSNPKGYLSERLDLYLDDQLVDSLNIGASLKGESVTTISIQGSGSGRDKQEAYLDMQNQMKRLQTVLQTGSLPVKLNIIKTDAISASLGKEFLNNAFLISILSIIAVTAIVLFRYHHFRIGIPIVIVITSEILLILGVSALLGQNIDIAGIAGIIVAIGTGVDDQIVITDETLKKEKEYQYLNWKQKLKKAFFIVFASYFATTASMIPLLFAGAGLLKGFAITTIIGVTNGVFITRPAFAEMIEILVDEE